MERHYTTTGAGSVIGGLNAKDVERLIRSGSEDGKASSRDRDNFSFGYKKGRKGTIGSVGEQLGPWGTRKTTGFPSEIGHSARMDTNPLISLQSAADLIDTNPDDILSLRRKKLIRSQGEQFRYRDVLGVGQIRKFQKKLSRMPHLIPIRSGHCVYFLLRGEHIVYVGMTACLVSRLATHKRCKRFNGVRFLRVDKEVIERVEREYIELFRPIYNSQCVRP